MRRNGGPVFRVAGRVLALWLLGSCVASCRQAPESPPTLPLPTLPDLASYEEAVRDQFQERYAVVERLLAANSDPNAEALSRAFGSLGMLFQAYGDHEPAGICYRNARLLDPLEYRWAYLLGLSRRLQGQFADSDEALLAVLTLRPGNVPTLVRLGENAIDQNHLEAAGGYFHQALETAPGCVKARLGLGRIALELDDAETALGHLKAAQSQQPRAAPVLYTLGLAHRALGNLEQAQAYFDKVPRSHLMRRELAFDDPLEREVQALQRGAMAHEHRGLKAAAQGHYTLAAAELGEAVALDAERIEARHNLALAYLHLGRREEARAEIDEVLARSPDFAPSLFVLALLLHDEGHLEPAEEHLRRAMELDSGLATARLALTELFESEP